MRVPVRLSAPGWPAALRHPRVSGPDPRGLLEPDGLDAESFSRAVSAFRLGGTYRTTAPGRHVQSNRVLLDHVPDRPLTVVDVGISDGSTTLELLDALGDRVGRLFGADRVLALTARRRGRWVAFFDQDRCVLVATRHLLLYAPDALVPLFAGAPGQRVSLVQPALERRARTDERVALVTHDVFAPWPGPPADVVRLANLLNRTYFSDADIGRALSQCHRMIVPDGLLQLVENRPGLGEQGALYRRGEAGFVRVAQVGAGSDVDGLVVGD